MGCGVVGYSRVSRPSRSSQDMYLGMLSVLPHVFIHPVLPDHTLCVCHQCSLQSYSFIELQRTISSIDISIS